MHALGCSPFTRSYNVSSTGLTSLCDPIISFPQSSKVNVIIPTLQMSKMRCRKEQLASGHEARGSGGQGLLWFSDQLRCSIAGSRPKPVPPTQETPKESSPWIKANTLRGLERMAVLGRWRDFPRTALALEGTPEITLSTFPQLFLCQKKKKKCSRFSFSLLKYRSQNGTQSCRCGLDTTKG